MYKRKRDISPHGLRIQPNSFFGAHWRAQSTYFVLARFQQYIGAAFILHAIAIIPVILVFLAFWSFQLSVQSGTIRSFYHVFLKRKTLKRPHPH
jgi:hypothetical protein